MKIVRPICCGMDIHKNSFVATIGITNKKTRMTEYIQETFSILNPDLFILKQWLIDHKCFDACMESTGKYWIPIFNILEEDINIYLTHPKYVKAIKGKILDSIKNCNIETDQRFKMNEAMTHMEELQGHINNCEIEMIKRASPMFDQFIHITQIPGISTLSAILIVSEIGVDMKQFESDK